MSDDYNVKKYPLSWDGFIEYLYGLNPKIAEQFEGLTPNKKKDIYDMMTGKKPKDDVTTDVTVLFREVYVHVKQRKAPVEEVVIPAIIPEKKELPHYTYFDALYCNPHGLSSFVEIHGGYPRKDGTWCDAEEHEHWQQEIRNWNADPVYKIQPYEGIS